MKTAAGIAGILLGIFSLTYVGIFGSMVGSAAGWLGSIPFRGNTLGPWAEMVSMLSWLAPLLTIVGGIVTFSNPRVGGIILGVGAFLHWYLLGFGQAGKLFVLPIGATAALALFARSSTRSATNLGAAQISAEPPSKTAGPSFDRAKWNALVQYDKDIALMAEKLRPLGEKWLDEFASAYLALNDKTYLPEIERKICAAAKVEAEENERQRIYWEEQRKASLQEQEHLAQERKKQQERRAEARRKQFELWQDRIWGTTRRKVLTTLSGVVVVLIVTTAARAYYHVRLQAEADKTIQTVMSRDLVDWDWSEVDNALSHGGSLNTVVVGGTRWPLISIAVSSANFDAVSMLIRRHADVNVRDPDGHTPLLSAVMLAGNQPDGDLVRTYVRIATLLLENGADVNALTTSNPTGLTPLDIALELPGRKISQAMVETLTKYGGRRTKLKDRPAIEDPEHDPRCHWEGLKRVCP